MSMISPNVFVKPLEDEPYEKLLSIRDELMQDILDFEAHRDEPKVHDIYPTPETRYQMNLEYLGELCKLIADKYNSKYVWKED